MIEKALGYAFIHLSIIYQNGIMKTEEFP